MLKKNIVLKLISVLCALVYFLNTCDEYIQCRNIMCNFLAIVEYGKINILVRVSSL
uniref:Uncharacterized protein n=1 Tax=Strigamia maritima TaxID=126957 RepID=T1JJ80_STRMM